MTAARVFDPTRPFERDATKGTRTTWIHEYERARRVQPDNTAPELPDECGSLRQLAGKQRRSAVRRSQNTTLRPFVYLTNPPPSSIIGSLHAGHRRVLSVTCAVRLVLKACVLCGGHDSRVHSCSEGMHCSQSCCCCVMWWTSLLELLTIFCFVKNTWWCTKAEVLSSFVDIVGGVNVYPVTAVYLQNPCLDQKDWCLQMKDKSADTWHAKTVFQRRLWQQVLEFFSLSRSLCLNDTLGKAGPSISSCSEEL